MQIKRNFLGKLADFGLNTYESKIWTALLGRGVSTAGELSDMANVPRSRSYDVLESLEKKGFVVMKLGKPIKYIANQPKSVLEFVKKKVEEKKIEQLKTIDILKVGNVVKDLSELYEHGISLQTPKDISGSLSGRKNLYNHLESMIKNAKNSVVMMTSAERYEEKLDKFKEAFDSLGKKRVKVRVALASDKGFNKTLPLIKTIETRRTDVNMRFCLVDGKEILFMLFDSGGVHPSYDIGIWVVDENLSKNIEQSFNSLWKNMGSFD